MEKMCHNCKYCRLLEGISFPLADHDCVCEIDVSSVTRYDVCESFVWREEKCKDCRYCDFVNIALDSPRLDGFCMMQQHPTSLNEEWINDDTVACCEFKMKEN